MRLTLQRIGTITAIMVAVFLLDPQTAFAHERWFVHDPNSFQVDFRLLFSLPVLGALVVGGAAVTTAYLLSQRYVTWEAAHHPSEENILLGIGEGRLQRVYAYLPLLLAVHAAIPLLVSGFQLELFAPNLKMQQNLLGGLVALAEVLIALALVYGVYTDIAALGLIGLFVGGFILSPLLGIQGLLVFDHIQFVGIAIFLYIIGRGPFSADALLGRRAHPNPALVQYALPALRWGLGLSIIVLAFTEKLLNPTLAQAFLSQKINFNFLSIFGVPDNIFIIFAGIGEFTFGALLISGYLPRLVVIAAWIPFNLTLPYLGWVELAGHLPVYGILLVLLITGPTNSISARRSAIILAREAGAIEEAEKEKRAGTASTV